jgi:tetratricopeptide (TPR) repeat protein/CHAT domain-containing protein
MKHKILLCAILLSFSFYVQSQREEFQQIKSTYEAFRKAEAFDSTLIYAEKMLTWVKAHESDTSLLLAEAMRYNANGYKFLEKFDTAIALYNQTLELLKKQKRETSRDYTETLNALAITYKLNGELSNAENCYLKAIDIRTKNPTKLGDKPKFLNNLGFLYVAMGLYDDAELKINEALHRYQELYPLPDDSVKFIFAVHSLAVVKKAKGEYEDAEKLFRQWFHVKSSNLSSVGDFASSCLDYVNNEISLKKWIEAEKLLLFSDSLLRSKPELNESLIYAQLNIEYGNLFLGKGDFDLASIAFQKSISQLTQKNWTDHVDYANACQGMAALYLKQEKYDSAFYYSNHALEIRKNVLGTLHPEYAASLRNMAMIYFSEGLYKESIKLYLELLSIYEKIFEPNHKAIAQANNSLAINYRHLGLYKTSEVFARKAMEIYAHNSDLIGQARMKNNIGYLRMLMGYYDEAEDLILQAIDYQKNYYQNDTTKFYGSIHSLACVYHEKGEYGQAEAYFNQWWNVIHKLDFKTESKCEGLFDRSKNALSSSKFNLAQECLFIADSIIDAHAEFKNQNLATSAKIHKLYGDISFHASHYDSAFTSYVYSSDLLEDLELTESSEYAEIMLGLSRYYRDAKTNYSESIHYAKEAAELQLGLLGDQHPEYAKTLNILGTLYGRISNLDSALIYHQLALKIRLDALGDDHPDYASSLNNIGVVYAELGLYDKVLPLYEQALSIKLNHFKEAHDDVAIAYSNIGGVHIRNSNYKLAAENYAKSMAILSELHPDSLNLTFPRLFQKYASLARALGDDQKQEEFLLMALSIQKKLSPESEEYVNVIKDLGTFYTSVKQYEKGSSYLMEAKERYANMKGIGTLHPNYAVVINDLGRNALYRKEYLMADSLFRYALQIRTQIYKIENTHIAKSNRNIGDVYYKQGKFKEAEPYYLKSLQINLACLTPSHEYTLDSKSALANCYAAQGKNQEALKLYQEIFDQKTIMLTQNFEWLNENEKELFWKSERPFFDKIASFAAEVYDSLPMAAGLSYNALLVSKSKLLEAKLSKDNFERFHEELYEKQNTCNRLLTKMEKDGITDQKKFNRIKKERDSIEILLNVSWPEFAKQKQNLSITWDRIQQNLLQDEAAIEFAPYYHQKNKATYYQALLIKKGWKHPVIVELCSEDALKSITPQYGFSSYYPLIWEPLQKHLTDIRTIYYAPSGELNNVPFHAIYAPKSSGDLSVQNTDKSRSTKQKSTSVETEKNAEFLMDRFALHQLTSTRYLAIDLKQNEKQAICQNITMLGGINYDYLPGSSTPPKKSKSNKTATRSSGMSSEKLAYLEGSKMEVEKINEALSTLSWKTQLVEGNQATLENFMELTGKEAPCVMHIATHGYAFSEINASDTSQAANFLKYNFHYSPNPMVRSGLILAGGNWAWTGSDTLKKLNLENGILTALEVSQLNLKKTKLVVLSACETGLGKIEGSEGTFGLKRGFKLAGVEQMIVSLWSVPDKETMELMTLFYTDLAQTLNPVISFQKAQKEMRNKYPTDPEKWAGFVLVR